MTTPFSSDTMRPDWFQVEEFPHGVTMIAEPLHEEDVKSYLVVGEALTAVLDTGMGVGDFAGLVASLTTRPTIVLQSHAHFDHVGASAQFERVHVHPSEADVLRAGVPNARLGRWLAAPHMDPAHLPATCDPATAFIAGCEPTGTIEAGDVFDLGGRVLEAFHTPGHSPGGITLLDRANRLLFPGDAVYMGPMFAYSPTSDAVAYRESLRLLAELARVVDTVYPSHNRVPMTPDEVIAMHESYEAIFAGRMPDAVLSDRLLHSFDGYSFALPLSFVL